MCGLVLNTLPTRQPQGEPQPQPHREQDRFRYCSPAAAVLQHASQAFLFSMIRRLRGHILKLPEYSILHALHQLPPADHISQSLYQPKEAAKICGATPDTVFAFSLISGMANAIPLSTSPGVNSSPESSGGSESPNTDRTKIGRPSNWTASRQRKLSRLYLFTTLQPKDIREALKEKDPNWMPG